MNPCESVRELIPWYVNGTLTAKDLGTVDAHLETCEACRTEVLRSMRLRAEVKIDRPVDASIERTWDRLDAWLAPSGSRIDVGSFLLGLSFGVTAGRRGSVRGSLRVLGQDVRILGRRRKEHDVRSNA